MVDTGDTLYQETIQTFLLLYRYLRRYGRQLQKEGISGRKIATLRYLTEAGPLTVGQLSAYLCISDSSTSTTIAWLERKGYLTRTRSKRDNRVVLVDLTPVGRELVQKTNLGGVPLLREALKTLPQEQLDLVHDALATVVDLLEIRDDR
jgi:DNA-binding MarR family transcriptional regulator